MKKIFTLVLFISLMDYCHAQFVPIVDADFRSFLMGRYPSCFNAAQEMDTTCALIVNETSLTYISGGTHEIKYFDNLIYLNTYYDNTVQYPATLKYLDLSYSGFPTSFSSLQNNTVEWIDMSNSRGPTQPPLHITANYFPNSVKHLNLSNNYIATIAQLPSSLSYLDLSYNVITSVTLPTNLDTLIIREQDPDPLAPNPTNQPSLRTLSLPPNLRYLDCRENAIRSLTLPASLTWLDCSDNWYEISTQMSDYSIPAMSNLGTLPSGLKYLRCVNGGLTNLQSLPTSLEYLDVTNNKYVIEVWTDPSNYTTYSKPGIDTLINIENTSLQFLNVSENNIDTLEVLPATLRDLRLSSNPIINLPALPMSLSRLDIDATGIRCLPELPASMGLISPFDNNNVNLSISSGNDAVKCLSNIVPGIRVAYKYGNSFDFTTNIRACTILNNPHGCNFNPVVTGNVYYDLNNNGSRDPGELPRQGVRVSVDRGETGFTDLNGNYALACLQGNNVLTVTPPEFYNPIPLTVNYNLSSADTLIEEHIALQSNTTADSVRVIIVPINTPRPGFNYAYQVKYENVGTTTLNATLSIAYNTTELSFINSSNAALVPSGNNLSLPLNALVPGDRGDFSVNFNVNAATVIGTSISTQATVTATSIVGLDIAVDTVQGSYDPNDKNATATLTPNEVTSGKFIDYLIRFQNTGTDTAFRVRITDTLSNLLQYESFEMIEASHVCKTTIDSIYVMFEFDNILLPDSNINEAASHGFVRFRVKPINTLVPNDEIANNASIYFDFNVPVVTNYAITKVDDATPVPQFSLLSFSGALQPQNIVRLNWETINEQTIEKFQMLQSTDGINFTPVDTITAIGGTTQQYNINLPIALGTTYFKLQIDANSGSVSYSQILNFTVTETSVTNVSAGITVRNNPIHSMINILIENQELQNTFIYLVSSDGKRIMKAPVNNNEISMNVSNLASGIYYLITNLGTKPIIIKH